MRPGKTSPIFRIAIPATLFISLLAGCSAAPKQPAGASSQSKYSSSKIAESKQKRARVTFKVGVASSAGAKTVRLWLPCPVSNAHQTITNTKVAGNFADHGTYREKQFGNTVLYAEWKTPRRAPELTLSFDVANKEIIRKNFPAADAAASAEARAFLASSASVPTTGTIKETAERVTRGRTTALAKAEAIYDYLVENFQRDDAIKGCGTGNACQVLSAKKGKCADVHSVFVAMARSVGVPAREVFGIRVKGDNNDMTKSFHCRAEFELPGYGWVPVDASDVLKLMLKEHLALNDPKVKEARSYFFGAQTETFVDFGTGRDLVLSPPQESGKLNYFMYPYAEIDGKALDHLSQKDLKYAVTFKEI